MNNDFKLKKSIRLVTATLAGSMTMAGAMSAESNIFSVQELPSGYMLAAGHLEGGCGADRKVPKDMKDAEGQCGEGKCGEGMKDAEGHCGHHDKSAEGMKDAEG